MYPQMAENFLNRNCTTALCKSNEVVIPALLEDASSQRDANCTTVSCKFKTSGETLVSKLSYSHINEIMKVDDPLARYFSFGGISILRSPEILLSLYCELFFIIYA